MHFDSPWTRTRRAVPATTAGWAVLVCAVFTIPAVAQSSDAKVSIAPRAASRILPTSPRSGLIRADVNRVFTSAIVTDSKGRPVEGLRSQNFRLLEDGVEQKVSEFFQEDGPVSIGVVLDLSESMRNKLPQAQKAISEFLHLTEHNDEFFFATFKDQAELVRGFTHNVDDIESSLRTVQPSGWTALYDAIVLGIQHMKKASQSRRVLLVFSDGADNNSRFSEGEVRSMVREANVRIFAVSVQSHTPQLDKLAAESGGRGYRVNKLEELPELATKLSAEVHAEYVLGFTPPERPRDGKYHALKVELLQPTGEERLYVSWRRGYYAPLE